VSSSAVEPVRRQLAGRAADTVAALVDAAVDEVAETGYDGLTIRNVARRAGVSPATAYTYFASKEHLLTEIFWRRLAALPEPTFPRRTPVGERVAEMTRGMALLVADEPALAAAVTTAMLAHDHDVAILRDKIGAVFVERLGLALGDDADSTSLRALLMTFIGGLLAAGMGNIRYADLPQLMADAGTLMSRRGR
jgi:AcrR family transcriptional regulator